jgi:hypothetical protein
VIGPGGLLRPAAGLLAAVGLGACATAGRGAAGPLAVPDKGYRVEIPAGWERVSSDADLALRRRDGDGGLLVHGTCEGRAPRRALPVLARHLRFGLQAVERLDEDTVTVAGQPALRVRFRGVLEERRVEVTTVTLAGSGCVYDLAAVAPAVGDEVVADAFRRLTGSFALTGARP